MRPDNFLACEESPGPLVLEPAPSYFLTASIPLCLLLESSHSTVTLCFNARQFRALVIKYFEQLNSVLEYGSHGNLSWSRG